LEDFRFTTVVARAVGSLAKFCRWIGPHWQNVDRLLLIKGPKWVEERGEARHLGLLQGLEIRRVASYRLGDDSDAEGVILQIWPSERDLSHLA
jgi:16S rRNA (guanine527-N7)-methyltransferase